jgi:hypothetical protein
LSIRDSSVELQIFYGEFETLELVYLPNLERMNYTNWVYDEDPLYLGDGPQLSKLSLTKVCLWGRTMELSRLLANAPTVTDLHLDFQSEKVLIHVLSVS